MGRRQHCTAEERRLVQTLRKQNHSFGFIAKSLGRSKNFVANALKPRKLLEKRGGAKKTSSVTDDYIATLAKRDPFKSSRAIAAEINNEISARTVRRRLYNMKLPGRIARKVPLLRKANLEKRKHFAEGHKTWCGVDGVKKWQNILWSDETKINLFGNDCERNVRRPKGQEFNPRYTKKTIKHGGGNVMVWGCFSWNGVGPIHLINDTMTKERYRDILEEVMLPFAEENMPLRWIFQQDNDPKHSSKLVSEWFQRKGVEVLEWPSQSPDLNPIENLWGDLKKRIGKDACRNKAELWQKIQDVWYNTPIETCRKLVNSMPHRIEKVIKNKGGYSGY